MGVMQTFIWSEDPDYAEFRLSIRSFLQNQVELAEPRDSVESQRRYDFALWRRFCRTFELVDFAPKLGVAPDLRALTVIAEELGRALLPCPFMSTIALAGPLASLFNSSGHLDSFIEDMANGDTIVAVACQESAFGLRSRENIDMTFEKESGQYYLNGRKIAVLDGAMADSFLVVARKEDCVGLFLVARNSPGISVEESISLDLNQNIANVEFQNVSAELLGDESDSWSRFVESQSVAAMLIAAEQIGGAERCLELSLDYVKQRHQFGRPALSWRGRLWKLHFESPTRRETLGSPRQAISER
jgi:alkylation response protein AidB-like acyl-CoA dehydrogenase